MRVKLLFPTGQAGVVRGFVAFSPCIQSWGIDGVNFSSFSSWALPAPPAEALQEAVLPAVMLNFLHFNALTVLND